MYTYNICKLIIVVNAIICSLLPILLVWWSLYSIWIVPNNLIYLLFNYGGFVGFSYVIRFVGNWIITYISRKGPK